jgi:zinc transporter 1/2/3
MSDAETLCASEPVEWSVPLHVGSIFVVLAASFLGVATTLVGETFPKLRVHPYLLTLLKTFGTGIVLSCAMIHMLLPAAESFANPCMPQGVFGEDGFPAYAYAFSLAAALFLQQLEMLLASRLGKGGGHQQLRAGCRVGHSDTEPDPVSIPLTSKPSPSSTSTTAVLVDAMSAELSLTVHSVFVGLAVGVVSDGELTALLVALVFHQFFEGIALGARLCRAPMSLSLRYALAVIFAIAAPVGQAAGVGVMAGSGLNTAGETFLMVQGIFDSLCAGLLLHVGFSLLLKDFPADVERLVGDIDQAGADDASAVVVAAAPSSQRALTCKRLGLHAALWTGAVLMALIGKYL